MASSRVDFPVPFSPAKKVMLLPKESVYSARRAGTARSQAEGGTSSQSILTAWI